MRDDVTKLFDLSGRTAVLTGAASGQGRSTAMVLAKAGAKVVAGDVDLKGVEETARMVEDTGGRAIAVKADVTRRADMDALVQRAVTEFGRVDIMGNIAGVPFEKLIVDTTEADLDRILAINLKGVVFGCQAAMKVMMRQRSGNIVNISSGIIDTYGGSPYGAYGVSKAGVAMLTKILAKEAAPYGIRVNCVAPGLIDTPFLDKMFAQATGTLDTERKAAYMERVRGTSPLGMIGRPEDIAQSVLYLASDAAAFMTGQILRVNGGNSMPW